MSVIGDPAQKATGFRWGPCPGKKKSVELIMTVARAPRSPSISQSLFKSASKNARPQ
jgi:hypothetical protein